MPNRPPRPDSTPEAATPRPFRLLRYFSVAGGVLLLLAALPLAWLYHRSEVAEQTHLAGLRNQMLATTYANALLPEFGGYLLSADLSAEERRADPRRTALGARIAQLARGGAVTKIKVYNLAGRALYSSAADEIGDDASGNPGFLEARAGRQVNELVRRGQRSSTEDEIATRDQVSSYLPVRPPAGPVVAVFELYSDVTDNLAAIEDVTGRVLVTLLGVLFTLYLFLLSIVARADRVIRRQVRALEDSATRLRGQTFELELEVEERSAIEAALRASEQSAAAANRAKSEFLSSMSHELRTPMNAILGFAQLLQTEPQTPLSEHQQRFVGQILKAGAHLLELIDQVLDLARIEAGKLTLSLEPVRLAALLDEVLPLVQHLATGKGIATLEVEVGPTVVLADYGRLKQLLLNLLSNAIKYNRPGGQIGVRADAGASGRTRIAVTDTGPGIAPERQAELFQPFARLGAEDSGIEGTGIGLALSRRLAEAMDGSIGVTSTVGVGSTFWIELPAAAAPDTASTPDLGAAPRQPAAGAPGTAPPLRTILYVEDNPANVLLMEELVKRLPATRLITAHTAELGLALAARERPDLVLLDINLPGVDGFDALARLQADPATARLPVMALTAKAMPNAIERGLAAGFRAWHTKPIRIDALTRSIEEALEEAIHDRL